MMPDRRLGDEDDIGRMRLSLWPDRSTRNGQSRLGMVFVVGRIMRVGAVGMAVAVGGNLGRLGVAVRAMG